MAGNAFTTAVGNAVDQAKKTVKKYSQAAADLAVVGKTAAGIPAMAEPMNAYNKADALQKRSKKPAGY